MKKRKIALYLTRIIVCLLILLQIAFYIYLIISSSRFSVWIQHALTIFSFFVVFKIISLRENSGFKIIWVFLILAFPILGGLTYLMFHIQSSTRKFQKGLTLYESKNRENFFLSENSYIQAIKETPNYEVLINYLQASSGFPVYDKSSIEYLSPGEVMFAKLIEELKKAEKYIFLEYFIIDDGIMWDTILEILEQKVAQGVDVRVMYDDIGSLLLLPTDYPLELAKKGIKACVFNVFKPTLMVSMNNRDHRKIAIIDGKTAFTGGINLADEYINEKNRFGHWKDASVMVSGYAAWSLTVIFLELWTFSRKQKENFEDYFPWKTEKNINQTNGFIQVYADSPTDDEVVGEHVYLHIITRAKKYLYIQTPYFIVDDNIASALCLAAKSGVDVRLMTPGHWDKYLVHLTTQSYYPELIKAGVKIYEYTPGFLHSKIFISDDEVATVGTTNLDYRSLYHHFECGVVMYKSSVIQDIYNDFMKTLDNCTELKAENVKHNIFTNFRNEILRIFAPLM